VALDDGGDLDAVECLAYAAGILKAAELIRVADAAALAIGATA